MKKVFVAGGTGAIGRPLIRQLLQAGYDVYAMTRSETKTASIRESGAHPILCDVFPAGGS